MSSNTGNSSGGNQNGKLFIGGLSFDTTDETFRSYFSQFGEVADAFVLRDNVTKRSRGFGFVTFKSEKGADDCLAHDRPHVLDKRQVEAKKATPRDQTLIGGDDRRGGRGGRGGLRGGRSSYDNNPRGGNGASRGAPASASNSSGSGNNSEALAATSSWASKATAPAPSKAAVGPKAGPPSSRSKSNAPPVPAKGAAPPPNPREEEAKDNGDGQCKKIFVGGLHYDTDKAGLRKYFEQYGKIVSSEVMYNRETNKSRGFGFVIFAESEDVDTALENRMHMIDNKQAEVKRATPRTASPIKPVGGASSGPPAAGHAAANPAAGGGSRGGHGIAAPIPVPPPQQRNMSWANVVSSGAPKETPNSAATATGGTGDSSAVPPAEPERNAPPQNGAPNALSKEQKMQQAALQHMARQQAAILQQQALQAQQQQIQHQMQMMQSMVEQSGQFPPQAAFPSDGKGTEKNVAPAPDGTNGDEKGPTPANQYFGDGGEGFGNVADSALPMGFGIQSFGGMGQQMGSMMGQQAFPSYDALSGMNVDMNSMGLGGMGMDMNSMNMNFGIGGFGMNGMQQQTSWGQPSSQQSLLQQSDQNGGLSLNFGQNAGSVEQQQHPPQQQQYPQQQYGMFNFTQQGQQMPYHLQQQYQQQPQGLEQHQGQPDQQK
jgi:RNA recognition motif-containing protein